MSISRYRSSNIIDGKYFETFNFPDQKQLDLINVVRVRIAQFDRLDQLAAKYLGDGSYWWIIALMNDISWGFRFTPGQVIRIPIDVNDVLKLF